MELVVRPAPALWLFLAPRRRRARFPVAYDGSASLGHVVQSLGVPLTEVGPLSVDGVPTDVSRPLQHGAVVQLEPPPRPQPLPHGARFLLDVHLGTLARRLRLLGLDAAWSSDADDPDLVHRAAAERRVLLTQDRGLLHRGALTEGALVRGERADEQLDDVLDRFDPPLAPWTRCLRCGAPLEEAGAEDVADQLLPRTRRAYRAFSRCTGCGQAYWRGAHADRLDAVVARALAGRRPPA
jgi:uncharacterized protein